MLGSLIGSNKWQWMARGKHPGLKDYFSLGATSPLLAAITDWIEKGYRGLTERVDPAGRRIAWRFWIGGHKPGAIVCGIVRDSSDSVGRPYPLMILGMGDLQGWEKAWQALPLAFDKTWTQMEAIATRLTRDLKELQGDVSCLASPQLQPVGQASLADGPRNDGTFNSADAGQGDSEGTVFFPISGLSPGEEALGIKALMHQLSTAFSGIPKAVFLGGPPASPMAAIFRRPLQPQDFTRLWTSE
ncbi:MAG: TagF domain-containing protein [Syntrophobacteraceae bacterium]